MKIKTSEKDTQRAVLEYLKLKGHFFWRNNSGAMKNASGNMYFFGTVGSPDIFVLYKGTLYGLEIKSSGGKQSDGQIKFQEGMDKHGGVYKVCFSLDDVLKLGL